MTQTQSQPPHITIPPRRVAFLLAGLVLALLAVGTRTLWLETVSSSSLDQRANNQQLETRTLPAVRGNIVDRDGRALAIGEEAITFAGDPALIKDRVGTALEVSRVLNFDKTQEEDLIARLTAAKGHFVYIARQVSRDKAKALQDMNVKGIYSYDEEKRMYPNGLVAGQLLGAVDVDGHGIDGLEALYEKSLSGTPGTQVVVRDPAGVPIDVRKLRRERDGGDVKLTIDLRIQEEAERVLAQTVKRTGADSASAIVLNPRTGEILAMANAPRANPAKWSATPAASRRNRLVTDTYEPGSVFKVVSISGAIEDGLVTPSTKIVVPPQLRFCSEKTNCVVKDAENHGTEVLPVKQVLVRSSNIGTIKIAEKLGPTRIDSWLHRFGFDAPTGIDFPGEVYGYSKPPKEWNATTIGSIPIGQSVAVTPIQVASAYAAIANDGVLVKPHVLDQLGSEASAAHTSRRILTSQTAQTMRSMFGSVVKDEHGTGTLAAIPDYGVGGKTGTANFVDPAPPYDYVKGVYNSSFVGFVPVQNPQLVTLVMVHHTTEFGGVAAAPAFQQITEAALRTLAIPPDGES